MPMLKWVAKHRPPKLTKQGVFLFFQRSARETWQISADIYYYITTELGYAKPDLRPAAYGGACSATTVWIYFAFWLPHWKNKLSVKSLKYYVILTTHIPPLAYADQRRLSSSANWPHTASSQKGAWQHAPSQNVLVYWTNGGIWKSFETTNFNKFKRKTNL